MRKILVIEDDPTLRENISELLDFSGYQVETAVDGIDGVQKAVEFLPDLIISDVMMPRMDGYSVLRNLRKNDDFKLTPFLFLTAKSERQDLRKGMGLGADDYLMKPFDDVELLDTVEFRLKKRDDLETLLKPQLLDHRSKKDFNDLINHGIIIEYLDQQIVIRAGEKPNYLFYIKEGLVNASKLNEEGKELIIDTHQTGEIFGYDTILSDDTYDYSVLSTGKSEIVKIDKNEFLEHIEGNVQGCLEILKKLCSKVANHEDKLIALAYDSVKKRIVMELDLLFKDNDQLSTDISRSDLAHRVGTTPETLARTLSELKKNKIIELKDQKISLIDSEQFNKVKNWY